MFFERVHRVSPGRKPVATPKGRPVMGSAPRPAVMLVICQPWRWQPKNLPRGHHEAGVAPRHPNPAQHHGDPFNCALTVQRPSFTEHPVRLAFLARIHSQTKTAFPATQKFFRQPSENPANTIPIRTFESRQYRGKNVGGAM